MGELVGFQDGEGDRDGDGDGDEDGDGGDADNKEDDAGGVLVGVPLVVVEFAESESTDGRRCRGSLGK